MRLKFRMSYSRIRLLIRQNARAVLLAALLLPGCGSAPTAPDPPDNTTPVITDPWIVVTPDAVGIDVAAMADASAQAETIPRFRSLLVVRNRKLAFEAYYHGNSMDVLNDVRSVTKSVVSTLTGIALGEGFIQNLDQPIGNYLHPDAAVMTPEQQAITIRHLLTMTGGFQWNENNGGGSYTTWINSPDHIRYLLNQPLVNTPGTQFTYNSAAVHLLGVLLAKATGKTLPEFADQYLFSKIGIAARQWEMLSNGYVNGGAGIDLRPRDLARFGQFILDGGMVNGVHILPGDWAGRATSPFFTWRFDFGALTRASYSYLWWTSQGQLEQAALAWGYGGQFIYIVPDLELVVVTTTNWRSLSQEGGPAPLEQAVLDVIINHVLPGVSRSDRQGITLQHTSRRTPEDAHETLAFTGFDNSVLPGEFQRMRP